ncbi:MAG: CoA ester lyase [Tetrasphaera sp.]
MTEWQPGPAWLFCPADRPERYGKALERSDLVLLDLEDAVAPTRKATAREAVRALDGIDPQRTVVRINAADTADHALDVALMGELGIPRVMLAKAERAADIEALAPLEVIVLVESPAGIDRVRDLIAPANVVGAMWGAEDLVAGLGGSSSRLPSGTYRDVARFARSATLIAAKARGVLAIDSVVLDITDADTMAAESADAVAIGFDAKAAIHPSQVAAIRAAYRPEAADVEWAQAVTEAAKEHDGGVFTFAGKMVDGPVLKHAAGILRRVTTSGPSGP